jgi:hypothetical protein
VLLYFPLLTEQSTIRGGMLHHFDGMEGFDETPLRNQQSIMLDWCYSWDLSVTGKFNY